MKKGDFQLKRSVLFMERGFIKFIRSREAEELFEDHKAFTLLALIAYRARRTDGLSVKNLKPGQALIGDLEACGLTPREYREAKQRLTKWKLATFKTTNRGTIAELSNSAIWDINQEINDKQSDNQTTIKRQSNDN